MPTLVGIDERLIVGDFIKWRLIQSLNNLAKCAIDWQMLFNVEKCVVMHIGTNNKLHSYNMNNATLEAVDLERDLGVVINKNEKYSE